jgi:diguanylate cyclase (GGDEF)-like protein
MANRQESVVENLARPRAVLPRRKIAGSALKLTGRCAQEPANSRVTTLLSDHHPLTGLPTLRQMSTRLTCLIAEVRRRHRTLALVAINLDGFPLFRETYGQSLGDDMLKRAAAVVLGASCRDVFVAHDGPDGFMVALIGLKNSAETAVCVQQILDAISMPRNIGRETLRIYASAGIAVFPKDGEDTETLCRNAWGAMQESSAEWGGALRFHSENAAVNARRRLRLEMDLRRAIDNKELTLYYQPQFEVSNGRASGVEALARWFRPDGVAVEPAVFIPLAERTRMIGALGSWVLEEACKTVSGWPTRGSGAVTLCVNVSPHQLDQSLVGAVERALEFSSFPAKHLELEITEGALVSNANAVIECLRQLKSLGIRIAIDDFGTGYSSLSYLSRLPVDRLKVDKSLIHNLSTRWKDVAILGSILGLGRELGLEVIAEGVETEQQFQVLKQLGCPQVQGYLLARPAPPEEAQDMLAGGWGAPHALAAFLKGAVRENVHAS